MVVGKSTLLCDEVSAHNKLAAKAVKAAWARIADLRTMTREELKRRVADMEAKPMSAGRKFEISTTGKSNRRDGTQKWVTSYQFAYIDKSAVVVGGFNEKTVEEAEALVQQMMVGIASNKSVEMIDGESPLGLATFDSLMQAMKFIRTQKKNGTIHTNKFRVSENRARTERARCKIVSKIKKYLFEVQGLAPANIIAGYKTFRVVIRDPVKWCLWPL